MKILYTHIGRIGDLILATPAISALRNKFPEAEIDVLAGSSNYYVIKDNPKVNNFFIYDKSPLKLAKFLIQLKTKKYDYYIDPKDHFSTESKLLAKTVNAKNKIGYQENENSPFNVPISPDEENFGKHYAQICYQALEHFDIPYPKKFKPELFENEDSITHFNSISQNINKPIIAVNISGSQERKMWLIEKWVEFLNKTYNDKFAYILTYGPTEKEKAQELITALSFLIDYKPNSINDVISLVKNSHHIITVDTAIVHIAAAFNKPILSLYSGVEKFYHKFAPLSDIAVSVKAPDEDSDVRKVSVEDFIKGWEEFSQMIKEN